MYAHQLLDELFVVQYGLCRFFHHPGTGRYCARINITTLPERLTVLIPHLDMPRIIHARNVPIGTRVQIRLQDNNPRTRKAPCGILMNWIQSEFYESASIADEALHREMTWDKIRLLFGDDLSWYQAFKRAHFSDPPAVAYQYARRALARGRPHGSLGRRRYRSLTNNTTK